ncbi:MAG TPA: peptidase T [Bellilinea sp.]|nr:peptidase T [Bellilinea sp.]
MTTSVLERFLRYVKVYTTSDPDSESVPSAKRELDLARMLEAELKELGLEDVKLDDKGYVYGTLPGNIRGDSKVLGLIAHMDTSPDVTGENVKPQVLAYEGGDIVLNQELGYVLTVADNPELKQVKGQRLVTTDGTTLLGADNKAGVAEIMAALEVLAKNPRIKHGTIKVGFTPDEEIGRGADHFDVPGFGADFAYTVDGGPQGELEYENFNAASAKVFIQGRNVHPGTAKNKMINALRLTAEYDALLPKKEKPELTEKYEGFIHLIGINGIVEEAAMGYIIRDHDKRKFEQKKQEMLNAAEKLNKKYGDGRVRVEIKDSYFNMKEMIEPNMWIIDLAKKAMRKAGIKPRVVPIRGGTDGARLSYMGLPCPNLFTGGYNYHGRYEYASVDQMEKSVEVLLNIIQLAAKLNK